MAKETFILSYEKDSNNNSLPVYGKVKITKLSGAADSAYVSILGILPVKIESKEVESIKLGSTGDYVNLPYTVTSFPLSNTEHIYWNDNNTSILIDKYNNNVKTLLSTSGNFTIENKKLENIKYFTALQYLGFNNVALEGDISCLNGMNLINCSLSNNRELTGNIASIGHMTNLTGFEFMNTKVTGNLEDFVAAQVAAGRTTVGTSASIFSNTILNYIAFGGKVQKEGIRSYGRITWASATKIAVYCGASSIASCTDVWCSGYTQEEAETAFSGKTIHRVDA